MTDRRWKRRFWPLFDGLVSEMATSEPTCREIRQSGERWVCGTAKRTYSGLARLGGLAASNEM